MKQLFVFIAVLGAFSCSRINTEKGARYVCSRDAGDAKAECPGGWVCGLEGFCLNPEVKSNNLCTAQSDCFGGWHCGVEGKCYDRATATNVACRDDGDCSDNWRCGRNSTCHQRNLGAPLACLNDEDCEASWRCGPDLTCIDSKDDALRANEDAGTPKSSLVNPLLLQGSAERLAISDEFTTQAPCGSQDPTINITSFSFAADGGLTKLLRYDGFYNGVPVYGANCQVIDTIPSRMARLPGAAQGVRELVEESSNTFALYADGGITRFAWSDAGVETTPVIQPVAFTNLKLGDKEMRTVLASSPTVAAILRSDLNWIIAPPLPLHNGVQPTINDLTYMGDARKGVLVAATSLGLFGVVLDTGTFEPTWTEYETETSECMGRKTEYEVLRVNYSNVQGRSGAIPNLSLVMHKLGSPNEPNVLMIMTGSSNVPPCPMPQLDTGGTFTYFSSASGYSQRCDGEFTGYALGASGDAGMEAFSQCRAPDGGFFSIIQQFNPGTYTIPSDDPPSLDAPQVLQRSTVFSTSNPRRTAMSGANGELWFDRHDSQVLPLETLALTGLPQVVVGPVSRAFALQAPVSTDPLKSTPLVLTDYGAYEHTPGLGVMFATHEVLALAGVGGQPNWMLAQFALSNRVLTLIMDTHGAGVPTEFRPPGLVATSEFPFTQPTFAVSSKSADGRTSVVVSSQDALLSADISSVPDGGYTFSGEGLAQLPKLKVVGSIVPRANITSLTAVPANPDPQAGARYAEGYLVTAGRVFRYHADNPLVWRNEELLVTTAEAVEVWADGRRARVGFRDGSVYGLPSRVPLAPAIENNTATVADYAEACGHSFALSSKGLYHLVVNASEAVGAWERVPLKSDGTSPQYTLGKLHSDGRELLVFLPAGVVERVSGFGCLP